MRSKQWERLPNHIVLNTNNSCGNEMSVVNYTLSLETMRTWVPEAYMSGDSLGRVGRLRTVSNYFFYLMPLVLGVPQFAFNISVVASVAVLTKMRNTGRVSK